jgi:glucose-1-phosphate adenylyltransferase
MLDWHKRQTQPTVTIATLQIPPEEAARLRSRRHDENYGIRGFEEKPQHGNPTRRSSTRHGERVMGIYVSRTRGTPGLR